MAHGVVGVQESPDSQYCFFGIARAVFPEAFRDIADLGATRLPREPLRDQLVPAPRCVAPI